jgi:hypothetical protein
MDADGTERREARIDWRKFLADLRAWADDEIEAGYQRDGRPPN